MATDTPDNENEFTEVIIDEVAAFSSEQLAKLVQDTNIVVDEFIESITNQEDSTEESVPPLSEEDAPDEDSSYSGATGDMIEELPGVAINESTPVEPSSTPEPQVAQGKNKEALKALINDLKAKTTKAAATGNPILMGTQNPNALSVPTTEPTNWAQISSVPVQPTAHYEPDKIAAEFSFNLLGEIFYYRVDDATVEATPLCRFYVPPNEQISEDAELPTDWEFFGTFNYPICLNRDAVIAHETKVCSYMGRFGQCEFAEIEVPVPVKQFSYDGNEVFVLAEMRGKNGTKEHVIINKFRNSSSSFQTYKVSDNESSALQVWEEMVSSYGGTVTEMDVPVNEKISFLAGIVG